jgi:hypothetical protein
MKYPKAVLAVDLVKLRVLDTKVYPISLVIVRGYLALAFDPLDRDICYAVYTELCM